MIVKKISSRHNPFFKKLRTLKSSRGIKKQGMALMAGEKNIMEVVKDFPSQCIGLVTFSLEGIGSNTLRPDLPVYLMPRNLFQVLDFFNTKYPILLVKARELPPWEESTLGRGRCVVFLPFQDPANIGAAIRSCAAFGVESVVILEEAASPFHPKSLRASGSTVFRLSLRKGPSIEKLSTCRIPLVSLDPQGKDITRYEFPKTFALVAGMEGTGMPETLRNAETLAIPIQKTVDSLNAAVSVGIALYQWRLGQCGKPR